MTDATIFGPFKLEASVEIHTDDSPELSGCEVVWDVGKHVYSDLVLPVISVVLAESLYQGEEALNIFRQLVYEYWMESPDCDEPLD